jgi:GNAT superfamily N-acetyltransferase
VIIRRIEAEDLVPLLELFHQLHSEDEPPSEEVVRVVWPQLLTAPHVIVFVGVLDGEVVATCTFVTVPNLTRGGRPHGLIENVVTARKRRRSGLGTAMLRHALSHAWELNCYEVMLLAGSQREETQSFFEQAGFRPGPETGFVARAAVHG